MMAPRPTPPMLVVIMSTDRDDKAHMDKRLYHYKGTRFYHRIVAPSQRGPPTTDPCLSLKMEEVGLEDKGLAGLGREDPDGPRQTKEDSRQKTHARRDLKTWRPESRLSVEL